MLSVIHHTHADDKQAQDALPTLFDKMISSNKEVAETQLAQNKEVAETRVSQNKEAFVNVLSNVKDMRVKQSKLTDLVMDSARKSCSDGLPSMIDIGGITPAKLFDDGDDIGHPPTPFDQKK
jgi:hypothetical protein